MIGIYKIENLNNHKIYIGQSTDIYRRLTTHKRVAFDTSYKGYNYPLYCSIRKYGLENFLFSTLEECSLENLNDREKYFIDEYQSLLPNGYNQSYGTINQRRLIPQTVEDIIEELINSQINSEELGKKYGVSSRLIRGINSGENWTKEGINYPIRESLCTINRKYKKCLICEGIISRWAENGVCKTCSNLQQRKVERPNRDELKKLIREKTFVSIGKQFNVSNTAVVKWCKTYNLPGTKTKINTYSDLEWQDV